MTTKGIPFAYGDPCLFVEKEKPVTEDKVRKAFDVAHELASKAPTEFYRDVFNAVFGAMVWTATASEGQQEATKSPE